MQLDQDLQTLIKPAEVEYWPLQPGWYIVLGILFILLAVIARKRYKVWLRNTFKREAIERINQLYIDENFFYNLNRVLKSAANQSFGREITAGLAGKEWRNFLKQSTSSFSDKILEALANSNYRKQQEPLDQELMFTAKVESIKWIKTMR